VAGARKTCRGKKNSIEHRNVFQLVRNGSQGRGVTRAGTQPLSGSRVGHSRHPIEEMRAREGPAEGLGVNSVAVSRAASPRERIYSRWNGKNVKKGICNGTSLFKKIVFSHVELQDKGPDLHRSIRENGPQWKGKRLRYLNLMSRRKPIKEIHVTRCNCHWKVTNSPVGKAAGWACSGQTISARKALGG